MKKVFWTIPVIFTAILLLIACKKENTFDFREYPQWPAVKTTLATNIDSTTAKLNGTVNGYGLSTTVTFEYGTTTSYGNTVIAYQSPVTGISITHVSAEISGLTPCTIYHYRLKAENSKWINFYGSDSTFISGHIPTLTTTSISEITYATAVSGGTITNDGGAAITERGVYWWSSNMTDDRFYLKNDSSGTGSFTSNLTGLNSTTTYYVQSSARTCAGIVLGNIESFTTSNCALVKTLSATNVSPNFAIMNGTVNAHGLQTTVTFTYLTGVTGINHYRTVSAVPEIVSGDSITHVSASTAGFGRGPSSTPFWVSATNACGKVSGDTLSFRRY